MRLDASELTKVVEELVLYKCSAVKPALDEDDQCKALQQVSAHARKPHSKAYAGCVLR